MPQKGCSEVRAGRFAAVQLLQLEQEIQRLAWTQSVRIDGTQGFERGGFGPLCRRERGDDQRQLGLRRERFSQRVALALEFRQIAARCSGDGFRNPCERGDLQSVALIGGPLFDAMQEYQRFAVFHGFDVHIDHPRRLAGKTGQLEVVRGE